MKKFDKLFLLIIIFIAIFLRFFQLGSNPPSLDWDEASLGYNAYSLLKTGKDEFGRVWPVSIRSFEDYKPALYTYLTIPSVAIFGMTEFAVRLPSAVSGVITVFVCYFLIIALFKDHKHKKIYALITSLLLAISPWHIQFSRAAFESNVSLLFVFLSILFFIHGVEKGKWILVSSFFGALSFYAYHSPRLVLPVILFSLSVLFFQKLRIQWKYFIASVFLGIILLIPFCIELFGPGKARLSSVTIFRPENTLDESIKYIDYDTAHGDLIGKILHNRRIVYLRLFLKGYFDHFNLDFLFLTGDAPDRHHARGMGMLYLFEAPFIIVGILELLKSRKNLPLFIWFVSAPLASAMTTGTPHAVRALLFLPTYQAFSAVGLAFLFEKFSNTGKKRMLFYVLSAMYGAVVLFNILFYLDSYFVQTPIEASKDWQYGYKQIAQISKKYEDQVDKIIITYKYDQPHAFILFYQQIDPAWYQSTHTRDEVLRSNRSFGKYEFRNIDWEKDSSLKNTLIIGTPSEIPSTEEGVLDSVSFLDGEIAFKVVKR